MSPLTGRIVQVGLTFYLLCHVRGSVLQLPKSKASVLISSMSLLTKPHCGCASCLVIAMCACEVSSRNVRMMMSVDPGMS